MGLQVYKEAMRKFWLITCGVVMGFSSTLASADERSYDCWVGNVGGPQTTHVIRCIPDRNITGAQINSSFDSFTGVIHAQLHAGAIAETERLVKANPELLHDAGGVSILLYSYPTESSWDSYLPHSLVQSALCQTFLDCPVVIHRALPTAVAMSSPVVRRRR